LKALLEESFNVPAGGRGSGAELELGPADAAQTDQAPSRRQGHEQQPLIRL
jgi:hypothetical protein